MRSIIGVLFLTAALVIGTSQHLDARASDLATVVPSKAEIVGGEAKGWSVITVELPPGAVDSWHSLAPSEFVYVLEGAGRLDVDGKPAVTLNPGTVSTLTSTTHHVLKNTSRTRTLKILVVFRDENKQPHPILATRMTQGPQESDAPIPSGELTQRKGNGQHKPTDIGLVF